MQTRTTWVGPHTLAGGRGPPLMIAPPLPSPAVSDEGVLGSAIPPAGTQYASAEEQQCALAQPTQKILALVRAACDPEGAAIEMAGMLSRCPNSWAVT